MSVASRRSRSRTREGPGRRRAGGVAQDGDLVEIADLLRDLHAATSTYVSPPGARWNRPLTPDREDLVCHNDCAPWNLVRKPSGGWALIDWDMAAPDSRAWELAYAAQTMIPLQPGVPMNVCRPRLRAFVEAYGPTPRTRDDLSRLLPERSDSMVDLLRRSRHAGRQPWAPIWQEDGPYWLGVSAHLREHATELRHTISAP